MFPLDPVLRKIVVKGALTMVDTKGVAHSYRGRETGPVVTMNLHTPSLPWRILLNPDLALGEAYMDGSLTVSRGDIFDAIFILMDNMERSGGYALGHVSGALSRMVRRLQQYNPAPVAHRNVRHHYDLSGDLYRLFLDSDLQYSCAYFRSPADLIEEAQRNKKIHIAAKLVLDRPGLRVLDIGSGWGGLALDIARMSSANVTGVTSSEEQLKVARQRAADAGMESRVNFQLADYRAVEGQFDRIVSVGMFEHVGVNHYDEFFTVCRRLLAPGGVALLHTIGRSDGPGANSAWIRRYIFPGGYSPALSEVVPAIERSGMWVTDIEVLRYHYAETLRAWRRRFLANRSTAVALYDDRFARMWEFYLAASECVFRYSNHVVFQIQFSRRKDSVPGTRDYIADWERNRGNHSVAA